MTVTEKTRGYLPEPCFGHDQLYVGCSRVKRPSDLTLCIKPRKDGLGDTHHTTLNVVMPEVRVRSSGGELSYEEPEIEEWSSSSFKIENSSSDTNSDSDSTQNTMSVSESTALSSESSES